MLPFKYEAYFLVPAILVGTFVLRGVFLNEVHDQSPIEVTQPLPVDPSSFLNAQLLGIDSEKTAPHIRATLQNTEGILPGVFVGDDFQWYSTAAPEDTVHIPLYLKRAGEFEIQAQFARSSDFGVVEVSLNGEVVIPELNLYAPTAASTGLLPLGTHVLGENNSIQIKITGTDPDSRAPHYQCALDGLSLTQVSASSPAEEDVAAVRTESKER